MLVEISNCKNTSELETLLSTWYCKKNLSSNCIYIRFALSASVELWSIKALLNKAHGKDWYRLHVYSNVWNKAFVGDPFSKTNSEIKLCQVQLDSEEKYKNEVKTPNFADDIFTEVSFTRNSTNSDEEYEDEYHEENEPEDEDFVENTKVILDGLKEDEKGLKRFHDWRTCCSIAQSVEKQETSSIVYYV